MDMESTPLVSSGSFNKYQSTESNTPQREEGEITQLTPPSDVNQTTLHTTSSQLLAGKVIGFNNNNNDNDKYGTQDDGEKSETEYSNSILSSSSDYTLNEDAEEVTISNKEYFTISEAIHNESDPKESFFETGIKRKKIMRPVLGFSIFIFIVVFNLGLYFHESHYGHNNNKVFFWIYVIDIFIFGYIFFHITFHNIIQATMMLMFQQLIVTGNLTYLFQVFEYFYYDYISPLIEYNGLPLLCYSGLILICFVTDFLDFDSMTLMYHLSEALFLIACSWIGVIIFISILQVYSYGDAIVNSRKYQTYEKILMKAEESIIKTQFHYFRASLYFLPSHQELNGGLSSSMSLKYLKKAARKGKEVETTKKIAQEFMRKQKHPGKGYIDYYDIMELLGGNEIETAMFMKLFDTNGDGKISTRKFAKGLEQMFNKQQSIINELQSCKLIVNVTFTLLKFGICVLAVLLILEAVNIDVTTLMVTIGTLILAFSFAYSHTLQEIFDSLYMIYVARPFNIGDIISVDGGPHLVVEEQGILSTQFHSEIDGYAVYYRNRELVHARIDNMNRGNKVAFEFEIGLHMNTSHLQVVEFQRLLKHHFHKSKVWHSNFEFHARSLSPDSQSFRYTLRCCLKGEKQWQNRSYWTVLKSELLLEIQRLTKCVGIIQSPTTYAIEPKMGFSKILEEFTK